MTIESMKTSVQKGFTLIELMIVIAIIGILASIAIPEFAAFRTKAFDSAAMSDVKNGVTVIEGAFASDYQYPVIGTAAVSTYSIALGSDTWTASKGVTIGNGVGTASTYTLCGKHLAGAKTYTNTETLTTAAVTTGTVAVNAAITACP